MTRMHTHKRVLPEHIILVSILSTCFWREVMMIDSGGGGDGDALRVSVDARVCLLMTPR